MVSLELDNLHLDKWFLRKRIFVLFLIFLISGCSTGVTENEINQGIDFFPDGLDPGVNYYFQAYQIYSQIYEPLIQLSDDYKTLLPCLAESWSTSEDHLHYTFRLLPNVYFHDGVRLGAEDVQFSFYRQIDLRSENPLFSLIDTISVLDSLSLRISLNYPYSPFLYSLASPNGLLVMSKTSLLRYGDKIGKHPVGTGPYFLDEWVKDKYISLQSFSQYREAVPIAQINYVYPDITSESEVLFKEGKLDILYMVAGYWLDRLKWLGQVKYHVQEPTNTLFMGFNLKNYPVDNIFVRRAILMSIDLKRSILVTNRGNAIAAERPLPTIYGGFEDLKQADFNLDEARRLLNRIGFKDGLALNFYVPEYSLSRKTKIELIKNQMAKAGIKVNVKYFCTLESYHMAIKDDQCHLFLDGYGSEMIGDPGNFLYALFHSKSKNNRMDYCNRRVDELIDEAFKEADDQKRHELYHQVVRIVLANTPAIFSAHVKSHFAYNSQKIESLAVSPYEFIYYHRLKLRN